LASNLIYSWRGLRTSGAPINGAVGSAKKNPKRLGFGFKSTPKEEGGGDKSLVVHANQTLTTSIEIVLKFIVQCKKKARISFYFVSDIKKIFFIFS